MQGELDELVQVPLFDAALIGGLSLDPTAALGQGEVGMGFFKEKAWSL